MSDTDLLSSWVRTELFSVSSVVTLTAAVLGVVAAFITETWTSSTVAVFGAISAIGVGVPTLYREWSVNFSVSTAFLWAVIVSAIAYGFYAIVFVLATRFGANTDVGGFIALGLTVSLGIAFTLYRTRIA